MADNIIPITAGSGTSVRTITNVGVDSGAHQQVVTLADPAGTALGTTAAPLPVAVTGDSTAGTIANRAVSTVTTTAASVLAAGTYRAIVLDNQGSDYVYIGATGVTTGSYFRRLAAGEVVALTPPFVPSNTIFAVTAAGTQTLAIGVLL